MEVEIQLTGQPIAPSLPPAAEPGHVGAWTEFRGLVRGEENGQPIRALEYEAYPEMAGRELRRSLEELSSRHPCLRARVIHRVGLVPVGEAAIYVGIASAHRAEGLALLAAFMERLKQDVPIWKRRALPLAAADASPRTSPANPVSADSRRRLPAVRSLDEALADIRARCSPLPPERVSLAEAFGRVLRETVCAPEDLPSFDRSAVDGYAIRRDDAAIRFRVVDCLRAGDWKPRALQAGEAVRIATGAALPGNGLQVVMQEDAQGEGDVVRILRRSDARHIRCRGEDLRQGQPLVRAGLRLDAGALALLASVGHAEPLVSPRLRVLHLTTGDEIVPPDQTPKPGQIRDSNSILIGSLLRGWPCDVEHRHLPEEFEVAWDALDAAGVAGMDLLLVSGGASVGERDFTRALLERLGFEIVFRQIKARPGKPTIFGVNGRRVAFGLPGNPLAHFVCFHLEVATALARLLGAAEAPQFLRGQLAVELRDEPCPRETPWPARLEWSGTAPRLRPLAWSSSGDLTCLADANALVRVPAQCEVLDPGADVEFLPVIPLAASLSA
jgi:molybdopterin molybdotransferase